MIPSIPLRVAALLTLWPLCATAQGQSSRPAMRVTLDADGHAVVRAVRTRTPIKIDGVLDEPIYTESPATSGFTQSEPKGGAPATEDTDVWVSFDDRNVYISAKAWEPHPERMIANE